MELNVVYCYCDNIIPHRKFRTVDNSVESDAFFSLGQGRSMLKSLLMAGIITSDEAKSAEEKLAVCGLNEDRSDEALSVTALNLALEHPSELWEEIMLKNIETGAISEAEAEKIRGFLKDLLKD